MAPIDTRPTSTRAEKSVGAEKPAGFEGWLRSPARLAVLALGFVALATALNSIGAIEIRQTRGFGQSNLSILGSQALNWSLLVALATPLGAAAARLARTRSSAVAITVTIVGGAAVAGVLLYQQMTTERWFWDNARAAWAQQRQARSLADMGDEPVPSRREDPALERVGESGPRTPTQGAQQRGARGAGRGPGGPFGRGNTLQRELYFRLPRIVLATWAFIGLGAALRLFLDSRERERAARRLELRASSLEGELARAQLDSLRAQLHPHFLFNALHSIGGLVRGGQERVALQTLDALGGLLRRGLEARGDEFVPLAEELELLERYLDVERVRLADRLRIAVEVPAGLLADEVPPFLLQPLVENAVRCAVAQRAEGGHVRIRAEAHGNSLVLDVDDDGPGFPPEVLAGRGWGIGLSNVRARLATLFEAQGRLELTTSELGGARARVTIPRDDEGAG